jgi:hypothetical protein
MLAAAATPPALPAKLNPGPLGPTPRPHFLPVRPVGAPKVLIAAPPGSHLTYYGGNLLQNVQVIQVLWGTGSYLSGVNSVAAPSMGSFFSNVVASSYLDWLNEYGVATAAAPPSTQKIGRGSFVGSFQISPALNNNGGVITDAQIQTELVKQITAGVLPAPGPSTYYAIFFPHGHTLTQGGTSSCVGGGFCAYHGTLANGAATVRYGVHPDMQAGSGCDTGCGSGTPFGNATAVASHELAEAITDPDVGLATVVGPPLSWYDSVNGEIGDLCNGGQGTLTGSDGLVYTVQEEFSNILGTCIVSNPSVVAPDFAWLPATTQLTVAPGSTLQDALALTLVRGSPLAVNLAVAGLPAGMTGTLSSTTVTVPASVSLQLRTSASTPPGTYAIAVTASSGSIVHSSALTVTVPFASGDAGDIPTLPQWAALLLAGMLLGSLVMRSRGASGH